MSAEPEFRLAVVVAVGKPELGCNLASVVAYEQQLEEGVEYPLGLWQPSLSALLMLRAPVFTVGELLVLDGEGGREVAGLGRKPSKWDIEVEEFAPADLGLAVARAAALGYGAPELEEP